MNLRNKKLLVFTLGFMVVMAIWWATIYLRGLTESIENDAFALIYPLVSLWGGLAGLIMAKQWGGHRSILGRAFGSFALGLLGQAFGQICYQYYIYVFKVEVPYPSIGDFGFFSTGIFYAYGALQLMKATGVRFSLKTYGGRAIAIIIPVLWALSSYYFFLKGYEFDWTQPITIVLDLISPIIDGVYLSLAILTYLLSRKFLGGLMRMPVLVLLFAILSEAISDYTYIYLATYKQDALYQASVNDFMYFVTYTLMALSLMLLGRAFTKLTEQTS